VVASDVGGLTELVGGAGVLVGPADVRGWTAAMRELLDDPPARQDLIRRGRARAGAYDWSTSARALAAAYRSTASG
jgi:glycosyltransferase involved in cell wall biosynthesis